MCYLLVNNFLNIFSFVLSLALLCLVFLSSIRFVKSLSKLLQSSVAKVKTTDILSEPIVLTIAPQTLPFHI